MIRSLSYGVNDFGKLSCYHLIHIWEILSETVKVNKMKKLSNNKFIENDQRQQDKQKKQ
jgi:hypothetical protein